MGSFSFTTYHVPVLKIKNSYNKLILNIAVNLFLLRRIPFKVRAILEKIIY